MYKTSFDVSKRKANEHGPINIAAASVVAVIIATVVNVSIHWLSLMYREYSTYWKQRI